MSLSRNLKLMVVHPGASVSTHDVHVGLVEALKARGHDVYQYDLAGRIEAAGAYLSMVHRKANKKDPSIAKTPPVQDVLYFACEPIVARALRVQPDWVVIVSAMYFHPDIFLLLQRSGQRVAVLLTESPYDDEKQARVLPFVNLAWTNERVSARRLKIGYVPHAYRPALHQPSAPADHVPSHDVVFVGTGFSERVGLLSSVDWTGIDLGIYGAWELVGPKSPLKQYLRGDYVDNAKATALYQNAKIGLNLYRSSKGFGRGQGHIELAEAESLNPRAYELAATGCFSLSTPRVEVDEVFGEAVPTFSTAKELGSLVRYWLANEQARRAVAATLPAMVRDHTWAARAAQIERDLHSVGSVASYASQAPVAEAAVSGG